MMRGLSIAALLVVLLAGCTSSKLNSSVSTFGVATGEVVKAQQQSLLAYATSERQRIRAKLAADKVKLILSPGCIALASHPEQVASCFVTTSDSQPIASYADPANVIALGNAMQAYALQLNRLAGDANADAQSFTKSLLALAGSVGSLDGALAGLGNTDRVTTQKHLDAVATIVATAGNLYLSSQWAAMLRRIIIASDEVVQSATYRLAKADETVRGYSNVATLQLLAAAEEDVSVAIDAGATPAVIADRQTAFLTLFEQYRVKASVQSGWLSIGVAHGELARMARSGASPSDMLAFTQALMAAARSVGVALQTLEEQP